MGSAPPLHITSALVGLAADNPGGGAVERHVVLVAVGAAVRKLCRIFRLVGFSETMVAVPFGFAPAGSASSAAYPAEVGAHIPPAMTDDWPSGSYSPLAKKYSLFLKNGTGPPACAPMRLKS